MTDEAAELELYIMNTYHLYQRLESVHKNLRNKQAIGTFRRDRAPRAFYYMVCDAAKEYTAEHGSPWGPRMFPKPVRLEVCESLVESFLEESRLGNYDHLLYKKNRAAAP